jgi:hypothetical protein
MITFRCVCGQALQVQDDLANCKARCPKCRAVMVVPPLTALEEETEVPAPQGPPTVSFQHDLTIQPVDEGPARKKKDPNP